jgi:hypothetical protein
MTQRLFVLAQLSVLALATTVGACVGGVAQAAGEIRIGVLTALTGPTAKFGQGQKNALTLARGEINGAGGIASLGGAKITLVYGDTRGNGDTGATENRTADHRGEGRRGDRRIPEWCGDAVLRGRRAAAGSVGQFRHGRHPDAARVQVHLPSACERHDQGAHLDRGALLYWRQSGRLIAILQSCSPVFIPREDAQMLPRWRLRRRERAVLTR